MGIYQKHYRQMFKHNMDKLVCHYINCHIIHRHFILSSTVSMSILKLQVVLIVLFIVASFPCRQLFAHTVKKAGEWSLEMRPVNIKILSSSYRNSFIGISWSESE